MAPNFFELKLFNLSNPTNPNNKIVNFLQKLFRFWIKTQKISIIQKFIDYPPNSPLPHYPR